MSPLATDIAKAFHYCYEQNAPRVGYRTRPATAVPWEELPDANQYLMRLTVQILLQSGIIQPGLNL